MNLFTCACAFMITFTLLASDARAQAQTPVDVEKTGTQLDIRIERSGLVFGATAKLRMDVDTLYRVSSLMGEPLINCGVRVRNMTGTLTLPYDGKTHTVDIGPKNSDLIRVYDVDLLARYTVAGGFSKHLKCNSGVPARDGTEPFNVASAPSWGRTFCDGYAMDSKLPDRLGADWCAAGGGSYLEPDAARNVFRQAWAHEGANIRVAAMAINANDLIVAEIARLRETAEEKARRDAEQKAEADRLAAEAAEKEREKAAEADRKRAADARRQAERRKKASDAADRVKAMLDRVATEKTESTTEQPPKPATGEKDRFAAMAERVALARAERQAAREREEAERARQEAARVAREREAAAAAARQAAEAARKAEEERAAQARARLTRFEFNSDNRNACPTFARYGGVGYRDAAGKCIAGAFSEGREFAQGFAVVETPEDGKTRFIDATGAFRFDAYKIARDFSEGFAAVYRDDTATYIDREGKTRFGDFANAYSFAMGVAPVQRVKNGPWTYIDMSGHDAGLGQFDWAGPFDQKSKQAIVQRNGRRGTINPQGQTVIPISYDNLWKVTKDDTRIRFAAAIAKPRKTGNGSCSLEYFTTTHAYLDATGRQIGGTFEVKSETGFGVCLRLQAN